MAKTTARAWQYQAPMSFRKRVNFNDTGVATGVYFGTIPAGAIIRGTDVMINVAFNAATTNSLTVGGNSANYNDIVNAAGVDETTPALTTGIKPNAATALGSLTADLDIYVMYQQTGTAATAGQADIIVNYTLNNDQ